MKKAAFTTFGCRYNQFETTEMSADLKEHNYEIVPFGSEADIYIINTCTVTGKSDLKCRNAIRKAVKQKGERGKVIVVGCYPETNRGDILAIEGVDMVFGNEEKLNICKQLEEAGIVSTDNKRGEEFELPPINIDSFSGRTAAYLRVQGGCDMNCSYCIVRVARGKGKSEPIAKVVERTKHIIDSGFKEIVLTGINLGSYGKDLTPPLSLTTLLEEIITIAGDTRIRLSSINPTEVSDSLINLMKETPSICRHLHISLQSGNDYILKKMRRNYDSRLYEDLLNRLVTDIPDISIGTDIMVGFPGETDEMFNDSYNLINRIPISYLHVFPYSARKGTDAAEYKGQIKKSTKTKRKKIMLELGENKKNHFMKNQLGKIGMVLFENKRDNNSTLLKGHTDNYLSVKADGDDSYMNKVSQVRLSHIEGEYIVGIILESEKKDD